MTVTHNTMNDGVFPEQNNLARSADEPFAIFSRPRWVPIVSEFLHRAANGDPSMGDSTTDEMVLVSAYRNGDSARLKQGMLKVVDEVRRVLNSNTQSNEILR
jgi:hypothetical protein